MMIRVEVAMGRIEVFVHLAWATWRRRPLIKPEVEEALVGLVSRKCLELRCKPLAFGGTDDHVHLLADLHATVSVATLAKETKGVSSYFLNRELAPGRFFRWQDGYLATSVAPDDLPAVTRYVHQQRAHHSTNFFIPELEPPAT
jgi:putative transposase